MTVRLENQSGSPVCFVNVYTNDKSPGVFVYEQRVFVSRDVEVTDTGDVVYVYRETPSYWVSEEEASK